MGNKNECSISTTSLRTYYYNQQFKMHIIQFMAIFGGLRVSVGAREGPEMVTTVTEGCEPGVTTTEENVVKEPRLIGVPIAYGSKDRVVGAIKADNTQNKQLRLPIMSAYMNGVELAPELRKGIGTRRRETYMPTGKVFPDDVTVVHQVMPVPYKVTMELAIFTSNQEQHMQVVEQILMLFDPVLQIQVNDDVFDWTKITTVELTGVRLEENYPVGTDRRIIQTSMDFTFPIYLSGPANIKQDYVKDIMLRIGAVNVAFDLTNSDEVLAELDRLGLSGELIFNVDDIKLS